MKGRKPVPEHLKIMRGNPGRRPLNPSAPTPDCSIPDAPNHLSAPAAAEWKRISVELEGLGLLSKIDRAALTIYCTAWGRHVEAEQHLREEGLMLIGRPRKSSAPPREKAEGGKKLSSTLRGYGVEHQKWRKAVLEKFPKCVDCGQPATEADHVVPKDRGGEALAIENGVGRCKGCHAGKTARDQKLYASSLEEDEPGQPYQNPWMGVSNRAIELMQSMLAEFGLSPSSRSRLTATPKAKPKASLFG